MITAGVDVGTCYLKICISDDSALTGHSCVRMGRRFNRIYETALNQALEMASKTTGEKVKKKHIKKTVSTGYGGSLLRKAAYKMNEPLCMAKAVSKIDSEIRTVINAGALFIRVIMLDENGFVEEEHVNEKCAAGSGRFLEMIAEAVDVEFGSVSRHAELALNPINITSSCAVFAESDVISLVNSGTGRDDVLAGVVKSIASKTISILEGAAPADPVALSGGLSNVPAYVDSLRLETGREIRLPDFNPFLLSAYGASIVAGMNRK